MNEHKDNSIGITTALPPAFDPKEPRRYVVICADLALKNSGAGLFESWAIHYAFAWDYLDAMHIVAERVSADGYFPTIALDEQGLEALKRKVKRAPLSKEQPFLDGQDL